MSLVKQTFRKQRRVYFSYLWRGLALMAIGIYAGVMIAINGMGDAVNNGRGANILISRLMVWLTGYGIDAELVVTYSLIGLFCILAAVGLFNVVRGIWLMVPSHSMLGKSVLQQRKGHESFSDVLDTIRADMNMEPFRFGTTAIGRKWILDGEVMRLDEIRGVFWFDQDVKDYVLCCVDASQNIWAASLDDRGDRDRAAEYLKKILPDVASGNKDAYIAFLKKELLVGETSIGEAIADKAIADKAIAGKQTAAVSGVSLTLPPDAVFGFVPANGIPTSNFTYEDVSSALRSLEQTGTITLRVLTPGMVSEIYFRREGSQWEVGVLYRQKDEECRAVQTVDEEQVEGILEGVLKHNRLLT